MNVAFEKQELRNPLNFHERTRPKVSGAFAYPSQSPNSRYSENDLGLTAGSDQWPDLDSMIIEEWGTTTVRETITNGDSMNIGDKQIGVGLSRLHKD